MATKIRLARGGSKKRPFYSIVVADSSAPRDGKFIEKVGTFNPMLADKTQRVVLKQDRVEEWLKTGAIPSDRIASFLREAGLGQDFKSVQTANKKHEQRVAVSAKKVAEKKAAEAEALKAVEKEAAEKAKAEGIAAKKAAKEAEAAAKEAAKAEA